MPCVSFSLLTKLRTADFANSLLGLCGITIYKYSGNGQMVGMVGIVEEPTLRLICIQLKYGPWRDALVICWKRQAAGKQEFWRSGVGDGHSADRARILVMALRDTCQQMQGRDDSVWVASLGRNISHVSGPLATMARLGIVKKMRQGSPQRMHAGVLKLGASSGTFRRLCSGVVEMASAETKVLRWVRVASGCRAVEAPKTCQEWVAEHGKVDAIFAKHRIFPSKSYMRNFVIRGLLLAAMHAAGVRKLSGSKNISAGAFADAFPDQGSWIKRMCLRQRVEISLADFAATIDYDGRVEHLTMYLCLLLNPRMRLAPAWFSANRRRLCSSMLQQHRSSLGVFRLPELCVQDCMS